MSSLFPFLGSTTQRVVDQTQAKELEKKKQLSPVFVAPKPVEPKLPLADKILKNVTEAKQVNTQKQSLKDLITKPQAVDVKGALRTVSPLAATALDVTGVKNPEPVGGLFGALSRNVAAPVYRLGARIGLEFSTEGNKARKEGTVAPTSPVEGDYKKALIGPEPITTLTSGPVAKTGSEMLQTLGVPKSAANFGGLFPSIGFGLITENPLVGGGEKAAGKELAKVAEEVIAKKVGEEAATKLATKAESFLPTEELSQLRGSLLGRSEKPGGIQRAIEEIQAGTSPPVRVRKLEDGTRIIEDGGHRVAAYQKLGIKDVPVEDVTHMYGPRVEAPKQPFQELKPAGEMIDTTKLPKIEQTRIAENPELGISTLSKKETENLAIEAMDQINNGEVPAKSAAELIAHNTKKAKEEVKSFDLPEETRIEWFKKQIQDKMGRLEKTQEAITKEGRKISEAEDAYMKQELFIGKADDALNQVDETVLKPILKEAADNKITIDEIGDFLYAKHAAERNAAMQLKNPNLKTGSGMSNEEAAQVLQGFADSGKSAKLEEIAQKVYTDVTQARLKLLRESGLETPESIDALEQGYKNYVPLKGKDGAEVSFGISRGKGFSVTGKDVRRAMGRESKAKYNPFVQAIADYQDTIVRAKKNEVAKSFKQLVENNPNPDLWTVEKLQYTPHYNKNGELIGLDPKFKFADDVVEVRENGKISLITVKDVPLAQAMKNMGVSKAIPVLNTINNYLRAVNTVLNPEFLISNFTRDLQMANINLIGDQGVKMAKNVTKDIPSAMKGIYQHLRGKGGEWSDAYKRMKEAGGKLGYIEQKSIEDRTEDIVKTLKEYSGERTAHTLRKAVNAVGSTIMKANEIVESAVRVSAFRNLEKAGVSTEKAAQFAKNLTVNFNKKGNLGTIINSFYLFANAGIQGSFRVLKALKNRKVQGIVAGLAAGSYGLNEMNAAINGDEYDKISDQEKDTNLIIMHPDGSHTSIPLPYGYNIFKILGDVTYETVHGKKTAAESMTRVIKSLDNAFNPISSGSFAQMLSPTALDGIVQQKENKNFAGSPIRPEQPLYGAKKKESSLYFPSVRKPSKDVTDWLNEVTGGTSVEAGAIDISPENVDHWIDFLTGGLGKFIANTTDLGATVAAGEVPSVDKIPFVRKFIKQPSEFYDKATLRDTIDESARKELSPIEINRFNKVMEDQIQNIKSGGGDPAQIDDLMKMDKELRTNQAQVKASGLFDELNKLKPEDRADFFSELPKRKDVTPEIIDGIFTLMDKEIKKKPKSP